MPRRVTLSSPALLVTSRWERASLWRALMLALLCWSLLAPCTALANAIRLGGTGSALGTMQRLVNAYTTVEPQFALTIVPNLGSTGGLKALIAGAIDIAVTNRPPQGEEMAHGLVSREYGKTPFVLITSQPGVTGLSMRQLVGLYAGTQTTWADGSPVRLVLRPATDGDAKLLAGFSSDMQQALQAAMAKAGMIVALTDQDSADNIQRLPGALGTSSLALLLSEQRPLVPLALNGVMPSVATIADGTYPYFKTTYLITKGAPSGQLAGFIEFLFSPAGQTILHDTGHWVGGAPRPTP